MPYTYQDYLDEQNKQPEVKTPTKTKSYTYSDYLAEEENDVPVRDWLKSFYKGQQDVNKIEITPAIRARYQKQQDFAKANPNQKPDTGYKAKNLWEEIKQGVSGPVASIADTAVRLGTDLASTVNPSMKVSADAIKANSANTFGQMIAGTELMSQEGGLPEGLPKKLVKTGLKTAIDIGAKYSNPHGLATMFAESVYGGMNKGLSADERAQEILAGGGSAPKFDERTGEQKLKDVGEGIVQGAKTVAQLKAIGVISKFLPKGMARPAFEGAAFGGMAAAEGGDANEIIAQTMIGGFFGWKKRKENYINPETKNPYTPKEQVNKYIDDIKNKMGGKFADQVFNDKFERSMRSNLERTETWRETQDKIQLNAIPDISAEMTPQERVNEIQKLTKLETENQLRQAPEITQKQKEESFNTAFEKSMQDNLNREVKPPEVITATQKPQGEVVEPIKTHRPMTVEAGSARLHDLTPAFGEDIYTKNAVQYFGTGEDIMDRQTIKILQSLRNKPDMDVVVYRAIPDDVKETNVKNGDWVTVNKNYATEHGEGILNGNYKIIQQTVKVKDLTTNADSFNEQGYFPTEPIRKSTPKPPNMGKPPIKAEPIPSPKVVALNFEIGDKAIVTNPDNRNKGDYPGEIVGVGELDGVKTFSIKLRKDGSTKIVTADQLSTTKENYFNGMSNQQINEIKSRNKEINEKLWENPIEFGSTDADYKEFQGLQSNKDKADFILKFHAKRVGIDTFGIDINNPIERIKLFDEIGKLNTSQIVKNQHATKIVDRVKEITNTTEELIEIMGEQATHLGMNLEEQGRMSSEVVADTTIDPKSGLRIGKAVALGKASVPNMVDQNGHLLKTEAVWVAEKNRAIADNDVDYLMELAKNSPVQEQISQAGKTLVLLRGRNSYDPVYQIMEINKEAKNTVEKSLGNKKVKAASDRRVALLETEILMKTKRIEQLENRKAINDFKYEARKRGRIRTKEELNLEFDGLTKEFNRQFSSQANIGLDPKMIKTFSRMALNRVEHGILTIEQVVDHIYTAIGEKIDKRVIRDAITGYGKTAKLSKDEIDGQLREVKRQGRLVSMLEDAEGGTAPLRTGLQRDKPTPRVIELRKQVEEAMRKNGLIIEKTAKSPEEQQLTAIQKYKNYLDKRNTELERQLVEGDYEVKPRKKTEIDKSLQSQKDHVDRISKIYRNLKEINELRDTGVSRDEAQKLVDLSRDVSTKKELITDPNDRSVDGPAREYGRARVDFFDYANRLKLRARKLTAREWGSKLIHEFPSTIGHGVMVASGTSKSILSSMDNSALGRQGIKMLWTHPTKWAQNAKQSFKDIWAELGGKNAMREILAEIYSRPMSIDGIFDRMIIDIGTMEEAYPEQGLEKIPGLRRLYKASETAFTGFQYRNRADAAEIYYELAKIKGIDVSNTKEGNIQLKGIGHLVNSLTGRGKFGPTMERASVGLNRAFFAPKFLKSNWEFLTMHQGQGETSFVKKQAAINMIKFAVGTTAVLGVAKALGADIELDSRSSDFLKIKVGNTRFDITGGIGSVVTVTTRLAGALISGLIVQPLGKLTHNKIGGKAWMTTKSSATGKLSPLTSGNSMLRDGLDVFVDFAAGKLAPAASLLKSGVAGVDNNRQPLNYLNMLTNALLPIGWQNMIQNWSIEDKKLWLAATLADTLGIGTSTYGKSQKKFKYVGFKD